MGVKDHHPLRQPLSRLLTAAMISLIAIDPSRFASPAAQLAIELFPSAMFTITSSSSTVTSRLPLQSPMQAVGVALRVAVRVGVALGVWVGVSDAVTLGLCVGVADAVTVGVRVGVS